MDSRERYHADPEYRRRTIERAKARHRATYVPTPRVYTRTMVPCEICGALFRPDSYKGLTKRACSRACGVWLKPNKIRECPVPWKRCHCGQWFVAHGRRTHCARPKSPPRSPAQTPAERQANRNALKRELRRLKLAPKETHRSRARRFGVAYEPIVARRSCERDGYRCGLCGSKTLPSKKAPHPRSPSLDHIVPMSLGGPHLRTNVQCACLGCNTDKGITARGEQLRLVG